MLSRRATDDKTPRSQVIVFGPFRLVPSRRLLLRDNMPLAMGGRALDLLLALTAQPGRVVTKRELLERVWPDVVVEEGSLRFHMTSLRRILGDGEDGARYVATQVGVGYAFVAPVQVEAAPTPSEPGAEAPRRPSSGLPPRVPLIGRRSDVDVVLSRLARPALLTLVGPGGVGKTSLAIDAAYRMVGAAYPRAHFVDLAQVEDPALVPSAIAGALGLPVQADDPVHVLLAHLRGQEHLLIIDNCEHVVDMACHVIERLRDGSAGVAVLATSREPLRARGEQIHWLGPLDYPDDPTAHSVESLREHAAVALFTERALAAHATLVWDDASIRLAADICRRLDGMALPIELAAVRAATHGIHATHAALGERFSLGWAGWRTAQPRQQTLRATLDWSYGLLSPSEQHVFDRLAIFVGPFSQEAAAELVACDGLAAADVAAVLDQLAAKGLVRVDRRDPVHGYRLLEMTRAYAKEKLTVHGHAVMHDMASRHAAFYTAWLAGPHAGVGSDDWHPPLCQLGNVRSALEWAFGPDGDALLALPLAAASVRLFLHFSLLVECRTWCLRAVTALPPGASGTAVEMNLQAALGLVLMFTRGNSTDAERALLRAMELAVSMGDHRAQLCLLGRLQIFYERIGDFATSLAWAERAAAVGDAIAEPEAVAVAASLSGVSHHLLGDQRRARHELEMSLRFSPRSRRSHTVYYGFDHCNRTGLALARALWLLGHVEEAVRAAQRVEDEAAALDHPVTHCIALVWTLGIYLWTGQLQRAEASLSTFTRIAEDNMLAPYMAAAHGMRGMLALRQGRADEAVCLLEESLSRLHAMRYELLTTTFELVLAEGLLLQDRAHDALRLLDRTIQHGRDSGDAFALPELLRLKAAALRALDAGDGASADAVLREALELSGQQGAEAWRLKIMSDLEHPRGAT